LRANPKRAPGRRCLIPAGRFSREHPEQEGLAFELAFALNAIGRHDEAIGVARSALEVAPRDTSVCRELAYGYLQTNKLEQAIQQFRYCLSVAQPDDLFSKSELAHNLSVAYLQVAMRSRRGSGGKRRNSGRPQNRQGPNSPRAHQALTFGTRGPIRLRAAKRATTKP
jgi:Flp pilus assembly protein TadD